MRSRWPADTVFTQQILTVEQQECSVCGHDLTICDHRYHHIFTLNGPLEIICKLAHCPDRACAAHSKTLSPLAEAQITLPWWRHRLGCLLLDGLPPFLPALVGSSTPG
jgi:hypothetical protein